MAQLATAIAEYRTEDTILVDAGDTIQANSAEIFLGSEDVHPMVRAMNALKYDVWVTGNHEYNFGIDTIKKTIGDLNCKALTGNVYDRDGKPIADGYTILEQNGVRIAVIGMVTPNIARWDASNLQGCSEVILFAATIGEGADLLARKYGRINVAKAVVMQAAAAAMIEAFCDEENEKLRTEAAEKDLYLRPRFSPGYGDFSLNHQRDFARVLEMQKTVGITLTESLLMLPSKSVTAVIGVSKQDARCVLSGCESCRNAGCAFRR